MVEFLVCSGLSAVTVLAVACVFDVRFIRLAARQWLAHADGVEGYRLSRRHGLEDWQNRMPKPLSKDLMTVGPERLSLHERGYTGV